MARRRARAGNLRTVVRTTPNPIPSPPEPPGAPRCGWPERWKLHVTLWKQGQETLGPYTPLPVGCKPLPCLRPLAASPDLAVGGREGTPLFSASPICHLPHGRSLSANGKTRRLWVGSSAQLGLWFRSGTPISSLSRRPRGFLGKGWGKETAPQPPRAVPLCSPATGPCCTPGTLRLACVSLSPPLSCRWRANALCERAWSSCVFVCMCVLETNFLICILHYTGPPSCND